MESLNQRKSAKQVSLAKSLRSECLLAASRTQVPVVDSLLPSRAEKLSAKLSDLVDHVCLLSHTTTRYLIDLNFDGPIIMLGRDMTPVAIGVGWCAKRLGLSIPLRMMDISNKFFRAGWDFANEDGMKSGDSSFIERLNDDEVTQDEARSSSLWRFFHSRGLTEASKCMLIDNGVNGSLLSRLNRILNICDPKLEIHNTLLYYSGVEKLPNVEVIVQHQPQIVGNPTKANLNEVGRFLQSSVKIEGWPHPYPSLSHFETHGDEIVPWYAPSSEFTSEGLIESEIDWDERALEHLKGLAALRGRILG